LKTVKGRSKRGDTLYNWVWQTFHYFKKLVKEKGGEKKGRKEKEGGEEGPVKGFFFFSFFFFFFFLFSQYFLIEVLKIRGKSAPYYIMYRYPEKIVSPFSQRS